VTVQQQLDELDEQLTGLLEVFARRLDELEQEVARIKRVLHVELEKTP
jgi:hypothetical protein